MPLPINKGRDDNALIALHELNFAYQGSYVLNDVSLKIFPGEFIGIIGPNGGGKTTLLKLIMGFLRPTTGTIQVAGKAAGIQQSHAVGLSYVPQSVRFDREFPISVQEVVLTGLLTKLAWHGCFGQKEKSLVHDTLKQMNLYELRDCAFGKLSGGQAQRVLIARALIAKPHILILDEPTASVDKQSETDIYHTLKALKGSMTILMVTHNLQATLEYVERVLCVQGNVCALKPEEVCQHLAIGLYHSPQ